MMIVTIMMIAEMNMIILMIKDDYNHIDDSGWMMTILMIKDEWWPYWWLRMIITGDFIFSSSFDKTSKAWLFDTTEIQETFILTEAVDWNGIWLKWNCSILFMWTMYSLCTVYTLHFYIVERKVTLNLIVWFFFFL